MNKDSFSFVVYMLHACANRWGKLPHEVFDVLKRSGCIDNYLVKHYGVLHTQGTEYLVDDIERYLSVRGVAV